MERTPLASPLIHPPRAASPLLLSIPHSGRDYPPWLIANANAGRTALEGLEDPLVDRLAWRIMARGIGAVIARAPRAAIDCNRAPEEVDPSVITGAACHPLGHRARGGLGIVPGRTALHGRLWRRPIPRNELDLRIAEAHATYHQAIELELEKMRDRFGHALLLDCHSMPSRRGQPQVVIGDRHGASAAPGLAQAAVDLVRSLGWSAALNDPYAGGFVIDRHGRPADGIDALQIEIDRGCYLAEDQRSPGPRFDEVARMLDTVAAELAGTAGWRTEVAAE